jgi:HEAT repeat protein
MDDGFLEACLEELSARNGRVREKARNTLVLMGPVAVPPLLELASAPDKRTRWEAAKALATIADPTSISVLARLLSDPQSDIRWVASVGLIKLGPRVLHHVLQALIENPDSISLRRAVHHVLRDLAGENPVLQDLVDPVLKVLTETSPASTIPPAADEALKQIQGLQRGEPVRPEASGDRLG